MPPFVKACFSLSHFSFLQRELSRLVCLEAEQNLAGFVFIRYSAVLRPFSFLELSSNSFSSCLIPSLFSSVLHAFAVHYFSAAAISSLRAMAASTSSYCSSAFFHFVLEGELAQLFSNCPSSRVQPWNLWQVLISLFCCPFARASLQLSLP